MIQANSLCDEWSVDSWTAGDRYSVRAFGSGKVPGRWMYGGGTSSGTVRAFGSGNTLDGGPMAGIAVLDSLELSVLDVDMYSLWMAPWDAGGTFRIGSRPEVAIRRDILRCVVQLSRRPVFPACGLSRIFWRPRKVLLTLETWQGVIDLYAGVSTTPVEMMVDDNQLGFPRLKFPPVGVEAWPSISRVRIHEDVVMGIPQAKVPGQIWVFPRASCTPVEICAVDLNFPQASFARKDGTI